MADDAFAISPISARAAQPSDADYGAIRDAFMETARGRWFLDEYAKRNRNADTTTVLEAVARLEAGLAARAPEPSLSAAAIVDAIRPLIAEARATIDRVMASDESEAALNGGRRGARIIREISWSLRETGTDPRICNILDEQLLAIEALHERHAADPRPEQISEAFDDLVLQVEAIAVDGISARGEAPESHETLKPQPLQQDVRSDALHEDHLKQEPSRQEHREPPAGLAPDEPDIDVTFAPAMTTAPVIASDAIDDSPVALSSPLLTDDEIAADDAMLGLIATEMAMDDDDGDDFEADDAIAELRDLAASAAPSIQAASPMDTHQPAMPEPSMPEPAMPQPAAPSQAMASSLGAALIANGVIRQPQRENDPLVAFRRMSQIEKIAFFS